MSLTFYSVHRAPHALPIWQTILDDLGCPEPRAIAKVLGVSLTTVYRWNREGQAPRAACLALFWLTRWGHSQVYTQAVNDCTIAVQYLEAVKAELERTRLQLEHVLAISNTGAANSPLIGSHK